MKWRTTLGVFGLAGLAGLLRYGFTQVFPGPVPLLLLNFVGIFFLVFLVKGLLPEKNWQADRLTAWGVGFFGGLTTIATPLLDIAELWLAKAYREALLFGFLYLFGGILVAFLAKASADKVIKDRSC